MSEKGQKKATPNARFEVVATLFSGSTSVDAKGQTQANIVGYILKDIATKKTKGVTVEQAGILVFKHGAVNATYATRARKVKDKEGNVTQEDTLYIRQAGELDSLRNPKLLMRAFNEEGKPHTEYTQELLDSLKRKRGTGGERKTVTEAERRKKVEALLAKKKIDVSF